MYTCLNKFRDNFGTICGYTLISVYGIIYLSADELKEKMKSHEIYIYNLCLDNHDRIVDIDNNLTHGRDLSKAIPHKAPWIPGGIMKNSKIKALDEYRIKFNMLLSKANDFAVKISKTKNIPYTKMNYEDTMDCKWFFYNGVVMYFDKMKGEVIISAPWGEDFSLLKTPYEIIELKCFPYSYPKL